MTRAYLRLLLVGSAFTLCQASAQDKGGAPGPAGFAWLLPRHLLLTFETYALPQDALDAIYLEAPPAPQSYERVRQLAAEGKASLESLIAVPTTNGQRAVSESVDEVIYGTEFDPGMAGKNYAYPTAFEMRPTGHRIEVEPKLILEGSMVEINVAPEFTRFAGFDFCKGDRRVEGELQPLFVSRKITTTAIGPLNAPVLIGTTSRPKQTGIATADGDGSVAVTFVIARMSGPKEGKAPPESGTDNLRLTYRFYSLARDKARELLATTADSDELHRLVRALPPADYKLERLIVMETRDGQRATVEETAENIYGSEFDPSQAEPVHRKDVPLSVHVSTPTADGQTPTPYYYPMVYRNKGLIPASVSEFEMRPTGWRIEALPTLKSHGLSVQLDVVPEHTERRGNLQGPKELVRYPEQPMFATQKITTSVNAAVGHQCFLGTMNAPHDTGVNGRKDDGRAWFAFVMVTME